MKEVPIGKLPFDALTHVIGPHQATRLANCVRAARQRLQGRAIWHVNSTAQGGGVAEMLQTLLAYERGAGLDLRWLVIDADPAFFALTKRLHHRLHGAAGDDGDLGRHDRDHFWSVAQRNGEQILKRVRPNDIVLLHDPQTAGLIPALREAGARVVWRCHIGVEESNAFTEQAWEFLRPYVHGAHATIFTRAAYVPAWLDSTRVWIVPPATDALSPKNCFLKPTMVRALLRQVGVLDGVPSRRIAELARSGWIVERVRRRPQILQVAPLPRAEVPLVVQVSRWDPLKDMLGVMEGFASQAARFSSAHLALVGPDPQNVADDPEGIGVYEECVAAWHRLRTNVRERVHLVSLPMLSAHENALMVNAFQRHAAVVVQKSLREGFGLTVTEAMYKGRPIIASRVGGIQDQITHDVHGLLLDDPTNARAFGDALARLLADTKLARRLGRNARRRAVAEYLGPRQLLQLLDLVSALDGKDSPRCWPQAIQDDSARRRSA